MDSDKRVLKVTFVLSKKKTLITIEIHVVARSEERFLSKEKKFIRS